MVPALAKEGSVNDNRLFKPMTPKDDEQLVNSGSEIDVMGAPESGAFAMVKELPIVVKFGA